MMKKWKSFLFWLLILPSVNALAQSGHLSLDEALSLAQSRSPLIQATREETRAAELQARSQRAALFPRLSLDANFRYVSEVPRLQLGPVNQPFGDNESYSFGPTLSYTILDFGSTRYMQRSLLLQSEARALQSESTQRQVIFSTRLAYVQTQLAQRISQLMEESLRLAQSQSRDISRRFRIGSATRLDALNSQVEVSNYELRFAQAKADLKVALADLLSWIGEQGSHEELELDALENTMQIVTAQPAPEWKANLPQLRAQGKSTESLELAARSQSAAGLPTIQLQGRASLDYPNGPKLEQVQQNTVLVNFSWPLVEWGRTDATAAQKQAEAAATRLRQQQSEIDLKRDWDKAHSRWRSLAEQGETARKVVSQAEELARLNYSTYRAGRISFLDVQSANLRLLEARINAARIESQFLTQYYSLLYLSSEDSAK